MKNQNKELGSENMQSVEYIGNESEELFLTCCGYRMLRENYWQEIEKRSDYLLFILQNSQGSLNVNNKLYKLSGGGGAYSILLLPGMKASFELEAVINSSLTWIGFSGKKAEACIEYSGFSQDELVHTLDGAGHLCGYVKNMLENQKLTFANELRCNGLLRLFFAELIKQQEKQISSVKLDISYKMELPAYIKNAISYISENYASNIKINELSDFVGVNRSYLSSSFKKATGYSPKKYLLLLRMENAKYMLEQTNLPINSVAALVGYTDQLAFSRMFKCYSGMSPKAYRESRK